MNLFSRPEYRSEFTQFLNEWKSSDSTVQAEQYAGRALLEGKPPLDPQELKRSFAAKVKREAYAYK